MGLAPLLILDQTEAEGPKKTFWETVPPPPSHLNVWIRHWRHLVSSPEALPLSYRRLVAGREIKLPVGTVCDCHGHVMRKAFKDCHP